MKRKSILSAALLLALSIGTLHAQPPQRQQRENPIRKTDEAFFRSAEARRIGEQIVLYQRVTGGWPKNIDMARPMTKAEKKNVANEKNRRDDSTTDNGATSMQMRYLARLYQATADTLFRNAFRRAVDYLLSGQYANGGWPQFWPEMRDYQIHITYNDNAMVNTMNMLRSVATQAAPYDHGLTTAEQQQRAQKAFDKGVECILNTQIRTNGQPTVWCQQHDRETMAPAPARAYELPSYCSQESANIVVLLMSLPNPDDRIKQAVHGAMQWFDKYKLTGLRVTRTGRRGSQHRNTQLVHDATAIPIWARYYDLDHCEPFVCDRDGIPQRRLEDIGDERRNGYKWFGEHPADLYPLYEKWAQQYDPQHKVDISLQTKGANENGLYQWNY